MEPAHVGYSSDSPPSYGDGKEHDTDPTRRVADLDEDLLVERPPHTSQRRLVTKIDLRVIPVLSILYLLAFLDRTNIANASIYGLQDDLQLTGTQYNNALTVRRVSR